MKVELKQFDLEGNSQKTLPVELDASSAAMQIQFMRSRGYSNKIGSILREYICNAHDANLMHHSKALPVRVQLPTKIEPVLKVSDDGPGIDFELFRKMFGSDKRNSNNPYGGFGIGGKCALSYVDSFTIETIRNGVYTIANYYDDGGAGAINIIHTQATNEPSGTTISISVKPEDVDRFYTEFVQLTECWDPKPEASPPVIYPQRNVLLRVNTPSGRCEIFDAQYNYTQRIISNSVPYSLRMDEFPEPEFAFLRRLRFDLYVGIGDIDITLFREDIEYTPKTRTFIKNLFNEFISCWLQELQTKINSVDFVEANKIWSVFRNTTDDLFWQGMKLQNRYKVLTSACTMSPYSGTIYPESYANPIDTVVMALSSSRKVGIGRIKEYSRYHRKNVLVYYGFTKESLIEKEPLFEHFTVLTDEDFPRKKPERRPRNSTSTARKSTDIYVILPKRNRNVKGIYAYTDSISVDLSQGGYYLPLDYSDIYGILPGHPITKYGSWDSYNSSKPLSFLINEVGTLYGIPIKLVDKLGDNWIDIGDKIEEKATQYFHEKSYHYYMSLIVKGPFNPSLDKLYYERCRGILNFKYCAYRLLTEIIEGIELLEASGLINWGLCIYNKPKLFTPDILKEFRENYGNDRFHSNYPEILDLMDTKIAYLSLMNELIEDRP